MPKISLFWKLMALRIAAVAVLAWVAYVYADNTGEISGGGVKSGPIVNTVSGAACVTILVIFLDAIWAVVRRTIGR